MAVQQKEMQEASDDEELSELDSDVGEEVEEEEGMQTGNEEDAEGEEEEIEVEEEVDEDDEDSLDSDDETPAGGSRASTPDLNKLTKRQRARFEEGGSGPMLALPDGTFYSLFS
jgi:Ino eighty subunit 2